MWQALEAEAENVRICNEIRRNAFGHVGAVSRSFQKQLTAVLGYDAATAKAITKKAKPQYRQIIRRLPEFEKADRFKMNIVNCAMLVRVHPLHAAAPGGGAG